MATGFAGAYTQCIQTTACKQAMYYKDKLKGKALTGFSVALSN